MGRLLGKGEKEYLLQELENLIGKSRRINQEKLVRVIENLKWGIMKKNIFAEFINVLGWLSYNKEVDDENSYNSQERIDEKLEKIHQKLEIRYNKFFGESPKLK